MIIGLFLCLPIKSIHASFSPPLPFIQLVFVNLDPGLHDRRSVELQGISVLRSRCGSEDSWACVQHKRPDGIERMRGRRRIAVSYRMQGIERDCGANVCSHLSPIIAHRRQGWLILRSTTAIGKCGRAAPVFHVAALTGHGLKAQWKKHPIPNPRIWGHSRLCKARATRAQSTNCPITRVHITNGLLCGKPSRSAPLSSSSHATPVIGRCPKVVG